MPPIIRSGGIKMKSVGLLSSNLPSVIDRSHLSPSREAQGKLLDNNPTLYIFYFYSNDLRD